MTRDELLKRLEVPESDDFEVKEAAWGVPEDAYKTVCAFANTSGGWIVFGVAQKDGAFVPTGVQDPDQLQNEFLGTCRSSKLSAPVDVRLKQIRVGDAWLLAFYVAALDRFHKPLRVREKKEWLAYVRIGSGDHRCNEAEIARFLRDAASEAFDSRICDRKVSLEEDLDFDMIRWLRSSMVVRNPDRSFPEDPEAFLRDLNLIREEGITHAALLLFATSSVLSMNPAGIVDFRQMYASHTQHRVVDGWDDREFCDSSICAAARSLMKRFYTLCPQPFEMEPNGVQHRALSTDYLAVREALINLLVHQDYADQHRVGKILWYDDRIVFENPGISWIEPPYMVQGGFTSPRNPLLARMMRLAGFVEEIGRGVSGIFDVWRAAGRAEPEVVNDVGYGSYQLILPLPWRADEGREATVVAVGERPARPVLKTILGTDLVGSTRLIAELGDEQAAEVFVRHHEIARDLLQTHRGQEVVSTGDGFLLTFDRPIDAVRWALAFHRRLTALSPKGFSLACRIGIHLAEVILVETDAGSRQVVGLGVSVAARLTALAQARQTLLSKAAFDIAHRTAVSLPAEVRWVDHGAYVLQDVPEPMWVCEVGEEGFAPLTAPEESRVKG